MKATMFPKVVFFVFSVIWFAVGAWMARHGHANIMPYCVALGILNIVMYFKLGGHHGSRSR
jgi:hypothetical protein